MRLGSRPVSRSLLCLFGLTLLPACGGGGGSGGGGGGNAVHFDSGLGFNASILSVI
jgi:hypothetical protein